MTKANAIKVLSRDISELIAAGEVIERPASVIKELVENSIDAGALHITVEIKQGGSVYMRITDDGCGIAPEEVPTAFLRHATSKIITKDDLDNIYTLGFRGEALASVSAVSRAEIMTKRADDEYGTCYKIEGGEEILNEKCGCPNGTTVIIRDLFYNVPARQKFMKKDIAEANAISLIVQKITLSHPEISFRMIRDNRTEFISSGDGELYSAIYAVYGRDFARDLIEVDYKQKGIAVKGYIIKPLYAKPSRMFQNFFVNGRFVRSRLCSAALESGFENMLMTGRFPACVLMLELPAAGVDVNIHPAKAEVRFSDEKFVSDAVYFAVKNALLTAGLIYEFQMRQKPAWDAVEKPKIQEKYMQTEMIFSGKASQESDCRDNFQPPAQDKISITPSQVKPSDSEEKPVTAKESVKEKAVTDETDKFKYINHTSFAESAVPEKIYEAVQEKPKIRVIGEALGNYIMAEIGDSVVMIDKHAAHERLIFERLKRQNCRQYSQILLNGIRILMSEAELDALESNIERLEEMGFAFDFSQKPYAVATAVPGFLGELDLDEIIPEIAENLILCKQNPQTDKFDGILHSLACKSAVRANDTNDIRELQALAEQIYVCADIRHCPHGRPVMFEITKNSIEKQFKRS